MKTPNLFTFSDTVENNPIVYANLGDTNEVMSNPLAQKTTEQPLPTANRNASLTPLEQSLSANNVGKSLSPSTTIENESSNSQAMETLVLPWSEKYWNLFITNPKSTVEIWARLIGAEYSVGFFFKFFASCLKNNYLILDLSFRISWII